MYLDGLIFKKDYRNIYYFGDLRDVIIF